MPQVSQGIFYSEVSRFDSSQVTHTLHPYDEEILNQFHGKPLFAKKMTKNLERYRYIPNLHIDRTLFFPDGTFMILAEQTIIAPPETFIYKHLLITLFDATGKKLWSKFIKKDNTNHSNPKYSSFAVGRQGEEYFLVYNGSIGNLLENDPREFRAFSNEANEAIILVELPRSGEIKQHILARRADMQEFRFLPGISGNLNKNTFVLYAQRLGKIKEQRFISLKLNK